MANKTWFSRFGLARYELIAFVYFDAMILCLFTTLVYVISSNLVNLNVYTHGNMYVYILFHNDFSWYIIKFGLLNTYNAYMYVYNRPIWTNGLFCDVWQLPLVICRVNTPNGRQLLLWSEYICPCLPTVVSCVPSNIRSHWQQSIVSIHIVDITIQVNILRSK